MKATVYEPGFRAQVNAIATSREMKAIAARVIRQTKVFAGKQRTGHYKAGLKVERVNYPSPHLTVAATDFKSHWLEWGAGPSPYRGGRPFLARHPLERAMRASGLTFKASRRGAR